MPEKVDAVLIALLTDRPLCVQCVAERMSLTVEGARAALDHLRQSTPVKHRVDRCQACGQQGDTVSIDRWRDRV